MRHPSDITSQFGAKVKQGFKGLVKALFFTSTTQLKKETVMLQEIRDICRIALEEGREPVIPDKWTCIPSRELLEMLFEDVKSQQPHSQSETSKV